MVEQFLATVTMLTCKLVVIIHFRHNVHFLMVL